MIIGLVGLQTYSLLAQSPYQLYLQAIDSSSSLSADEQQYNRSYPDSLSLIKALQTLLFDLHGQAYLEASIDRLVFEDSLCNAYLHKGEMYQWAQLDISGVDEAYLSQVGFRERRYSQKPFYYKEVIRLQESLIEYAENNGYPFASIRLADLQLGSGSLSARLSMEKGRLVYFEGLNIITEDVRLSKRYLENYLGIREGALFSLAKVKRIRTRIKELPFVQEIRDATITFTGNKATINLFLKKRKNSRWDFIIGILPSGTGESSTINLTGALTGDLQNQFGRGEQLFIDFERLRPEIQELEMRLVYPYLLNLPFGFDTQFELYRRDSTYRDLHVDVGVQYLFEGGNYVRAFWKNSSTALLNIDENRIKTSRQLPENLDLTNAIFGLEYNYRKLDFRFNPRRGWGIRLKGGAGIKRIEKNTNIVNLELASDPTFDFNTLYDTLNLRTFQFSLESMVEAYLPFSLIGKNTLKLGLQSGIIFSDQAIYQNEQYRLGGNRLLRGFDEESIFATRYAIFTLEGRILLQESSYSYFYLFGDYGYVEDITTTRRQFNQLLGIGLGMTFQTKAGVFALSLASGTRRNTPFDFRNPKVHFGYVSYF
ncbi:MAG: BamA/TamA family outer membrane protein [Bacteroidota bacterium]